MNSLFTSIAPVLVLLALEFTVVFGVAFLVQRWVRAATWRRLLWQTTFLCAGLLILIEISGVGGALPGWARPKPRPGEDPVRTAERNLMVSSSPDLGLPLAHPASEPVNGPNLVRANETIGNRPSVARWLGWLWMTGFVLVAGRMGLARLGFLLLARRRRVQDPSLTDALGQLAQRLGIGRAVRLTEMDGLVGPIAHGIWRWSISVPPGFAGRFTPVQQRAMLAHELAHVAAWDPAWQGYTDLVGALLWWHPLVWLARRTFHQASEAAADEASLVIEDGPGALAESLVVVGGQLTRIGASGWLGIQGGAFRSGLGQRVKRLVGLGPQTWQPLRSSTLAAVRTIGPLILGAAALLVAAWVRPPQSGNLRNLQAAFRQSILGLAFIELGPVAPANGGDLTSSTQKPSAKPEPAPGSPHSAAPHPDGGPAADSASGSETAYQVRQGDTLSWIVQRQRERGRSITQQQLRDANPRVNWNRLRVGQLIQLPPVTQSSAPNSDLLYPTLPPQRAGPASPAAGRYAGVELQTNAAPPPPGATFAQVPGPPVTEPPTTELQTRWFKVNSSTLSLRLRDWLGPNASSRTNNGMDALLSDLRRLLHQAGAQFSEPGGQLIYNDRGGLIMVRTTLAELDLVEQTIQALNSPPPQVTVEVKLCELSEDAVGELSRRTAELPLGNILRGALATNAGTLTSILSESQFAATLHALEEQRGVDLLSAPKVTTLSGRQAQVKTVNVRYIVTGLDLSTNLTAPGAKADGGLAIQPIAEPFELGPVIDVVPYVQADNNTVQLTVITSIKEFQGYDNEQEMQAALRLAGETQRMPAPLPRFRLRQVSTSALVEDGHTLVLLGGTVEDQLGEPRNATPPKPGGPAGKSAAPGPGRQKTLLVLVTPRIIDPAGNPINR